MTAPYDFFSPISIVDWTDASNPFFAPPALMTWFDFKNNIISHYGNKSAFIASATDNGIYKFIHPNFPDAWDLALMYFGNSFNFPAGVYGGAVSNPPYVHPPSPQTAYSGQFVSVSKTDITYNNKEFSTCDFMGLTSPFPWGWESNAGGIPPVPYFSGFLFDDSLTTTFDDCFLRPNADAIIPKISGVSYGTAFSVCVGSRVVDLQGLADWIFGSIPITNPIAFKMQYPPANPAPTDILIPNHVSPAQKTPIHFQNYTQPLPPYIKK